MTPYKKADPSKILLVDISHWQNSPTTPEKVDIDKMKSRGVSGVIMKVGQGIVLDRDFLSNFESCIQAEMPKGGYWYYDNRVDPKRQAEKCAEAAPWIYAELGIWLDLEDRRPGVFSGWNNWYVFLSHLSELVPNVKIGIYTGYYYWIEQTKSIGIPASSLSWFKRFPLWLAAYTEKSPMIPEPWDKYTIWQFTDLLDGQYYGVESKELDGNYFNGNAEDYIRFFDLNDVPTVPPSVEVVEKIVVVYSNGVTHTYRRDK